jgi:hypothetical protein
VRCDCVSFARHPYYAVRLFMVGTIPKQSRPTAPIPPTNAPPCRRRVSRRLCTGCAVYRDSTWMCGAIVSGLHSISMDVRCDCFSFAQRQSNRDRFYLFNTTWLFLFLTPVSILQWNTPGQPCQYFVTDGAGGRCQFIHGYILTPKLHRIADFHIFKTAEIHTYRIH